MTRARHYWVNSLHIENHLSTHDDDGGGGGGGGEGDRRWQTQNEIGVDGRWVRVIIISSQFICTIFFRFFSIYAHANRTANSMPSIVCHTQHQKLSFFIINFVLVFICVWAELLLFSTPFCLCGSSSLPSSSTLFLFARHSCSARTTWALIFALYFLAFCSSACSQTQSFPLAPG